MGLGTPPRSASPLKPVRHSFGVLVIFYLTFGSQRGARGEGPSHDERNLRPPSGLARAGPGDPITPPGPFNCLAGYGVSSMGQVLGAVVPMAIIPSVSHTFKSQPRPDPSSTGQACYSSAQVNSETSISAEWPSPHLAGLTACSGTPDRTAPSPTNDWSRTYVSYSPWGRLPPGPTNPGPHH